MASNSFYLEFGQPGMVYVSTKAGKLRSMTKIGPFKKVTLIMILIILGFIFGFRNYLFMYL